MISEWERQGRALLSTGLPVVHYRNFDGMSLVVALNDVTECWCAYVGIPVGHLLSGRGTWDFRMKMIDAGDGVSYSSSEVPPSVIKAVANYGVEYDDVAWWIGVSRPHFESGTAGREDVHEAAVELFKQVQWSGYACI